MSSGFDAFLAQAWADHADHSNAVAERLRTDTPAPTTPAQLSALARFVLHLLGEHLGRFDDARSLLEMLSTDSRADDSVRSTVRTSAAALNLAEGKPAAMARFSDLECVRTESGAAAVCIGIGQTERALVFVAKARRRLAALPQATPDDHRPLAVACHNMAWVLHDRGASRSTADTAAMLEIAALSREHWSHAGTWLEVERGDYDLARTHLSAGLLDDALHHAASCLSACLSHDAPAYELFFGHEALALALHARGDAAARDQHVAAAQAAFDRLGPDDQSDCRGTLDTLHALAPVA